MNLSSDPEVALIHQYEKTIGRLDGQIVRLRWLLSELRKVVGGQKSAEDMRAIIGEVDSVLE